MEPLKHYSWLHPCGWVDVFIWPSRKWRKPHWDRWTGVQTLSCGRFTIAFGWHWPPKAPVLA